MRKVTYTDLEDINALRTVTLVKNSIFTITARLNGEDNILVELTTLDDLEIKKAKILEIEDLSLSESVRILRILNGKGFWKTFDDYIDELATQAETFAKSLRTWAKRVDEEEEKEKGNSYLFSYDTLRAVFENEEQSSDERRTNQFCISIYHGEPWEHFVTISCETFDGNYYRSSDIDEDYNIKLEGMTFLAFVDRVKAIEEEILEDIRYFRDYYNEKGQELADIYNEITKIMERD